MFSFLFRRTSPQPFNIPMYAMYDIAFWTNCMDSINTSFLVGKIGGIVLRFQSEVGCHISFSIKSFD